MPKEIRLYSLEELTNENDEIILETEINTQINIELSSEKKTIISFPFGNKFEVKGNYIMISPITRES